MGAQTSDTVHNLLVSQKIIDAKKINVLPAFKKPEEKAAEPVAGAAAVGEAEGERRPEGEGEPKVSAEQASEDNAVVEEKAAE